MIKAICSKKIIKDMVYYSYIEDIINDENVQRLAEYKHHHYKH